MASAALSSHSYPNHAAPTWLRLGVASTLAAWLLVVLMAGAAQAFIGPIGQPPIRMGIAVIAPVVAFFLAFRTSRSFREAVLAADLRWISALQAWRFGGFAFLALYAYAVLPGSFAWPAGLGDMAIGFTAPWIVLALLHRPGFAASKTFVAWNMLGILDLIAAVSTGAASSALATGAAGEISARPMADLPLVLIPAYFVPVFLMLHATALLQVWHARGKPVERAQR
jgi:hypothetical protein